MVRINWWYTSLILLILCNVSLDLCSNKYGPLLVAVLCVIIVKDVASLVLLYAL